MSKIIPLILFTGCALLCQTVSADPAAAWKGNAELGVLVTNGNTKTKNITAKGQVINDRDRWRHTVAAEILNSAESGHTTAERYFVSGKSDLKLNELSYLFGLVTYENDRFTGFDYRVTETLGYGRSVIKGPALTLDLEAGLGARQSKVKSTQEDQDEGLIHVAGNLGWKVSASSTFSEVLTSDIGKDTTITKSVTGLKSQIVGNLASNISFTATHTSKVPAGVTKLDTQTGVTLVYSF
jgi:putative salt-induced outer membrane protein